MTMTPSPELLDRERRVIDMRRSGATFEDIAAAVGYANHTGAWHAYRRAMRRTLTDAGTEDIRQLELSRLDRLQEALWPQAMNGDTTAVHAVIKILDRRARYLGLDAPRTTHTRLTTPHPADIDAELARLIALLATPPDQ